MKRTFTYSTIIIWCIKMPQNYIYIYIWINEIKHRATKFIRIYSSTSRRKHTHVMLSRANRDRLKFWMKKIRSNSDRLIYMWEELIKYYYSILRTQHD